MFSGVARLFAVTYASGMTMLTITADGASAVIDTTGAELQSLCLGGREVMWSGDPAWWAGRAPILFPIVGGLPGDAFRLDGQSYALPKHGFARRSVFRVAAQAPDAVTLYLEDDAQTRAAWPFAFRLDLHFSVAGGRLDMQATVTNPGVRDMPFSFGFHPAFRWPLPDGGARDAHVMRFQHAEGPTIGRVGPDGLLTDVPHPSPLDGDTLRLHDSLFVEDALIFPALASRGLHYGVPGHPGLAIGWQGLPDLGIWMKPGADYVCVEPWAGFAAPQGFSGDLWDKPGIIRLAPGAQRRFGMWVEAA